MKFLQLQAACDFLHWSMKRNPSFTIFDEMDTRTVENFLEYSKHTVALRGLTISGNDMVELMDVLNPMNKIVYMLQMANAKTFFTILPLRIVVGDWKKRLIEILQKAGYEVVFLYCASLSGTVVGRVLISLKASRNFDSKDIGKLLRADFRWGQHSSNPFISLLPVTTSQTWALAAAHVAYYHVHEGTLPPPGQPYDTIEKLMVEGLSEARVRLALNYAISIPSQRQICGLIRGSRLPEHAEELALRTVSDRLERSGFKVDFSDTGLAWCKEQTHALAAHAFFHAKNEEVSEKIKSHIATMCQQFHGSRFFAVTTKKGGAEQGLSLQILLLFCEPVQILGQEGLNNWMQSLSRSCKHSACLSLVPVDICLRPVVSPLVTMLVSTFSSATRESRGEFARQLEAHALHSKDAISRPVRAFGSCVIADTPIPVHILAQAAQMLIPFLPGAVPPSDSGVRIMVGEIGKAPSCRQSSSAPSTTSGTEIVSFSTTSRSPSPHEAQLVRLPISRDTSPSREPEGRLLPYYPLVDEVMRAYSKEQVIAELDFARPAWLDWDLTRMMAFYDLEPPVCQKVYSNAILGNFVTFQHCLDPFYHHFTIAADRLGKLMTGDSRASGGLYFALTNSAGGIKGLMPVVSSFQHVLPEPPTTADETDPHARKRSRDKLVLDVMRVQKRPRIVGGLFARLPTRESPFHRMAACLSGVYDDLESLMPDDAQDEFWLHVQWEHVCSVLSKMERSLLLARDMIDGIDYKRAPGAFMFRD